MIFYEGFWKDLKTSEADPEIYGSGS